MNMSLKIRSLALSALGVGLLLAPASSFAANYVYTANKTADLVTVVDADTHDVVTTITGINGPFRIAVSGTGVYVTAMDENKVYRIDATTNTIETSVTVGGSPSGVAVSGTGVYVVNNSDSTVSLIDMVGFEVVRTISLTSGYNQFIAINGNFAYVADASNDRIRIVNLTTNAQTASVAVGDWPEGGIAFYGTGAYVTNRESSNVSVIDLDDNTVIRTISTGTAPEGAVTIGSLVYTGNNGDGTISVINPTTYTVVDTLDMESSYAFDLATYDGNIVVSKFAGHAVAFVDPDDGTVLDSTDVTTLIFGIAVYDGPDDVTPPSAPTSFAADVDGDDVTLTWVNPVTDFDHVSIFGSTSGYLSDTTHGGAVVTGLAGSTWTVNNLADATYYYSIFAMDESDNVSVPTYLTFVVDTAVTSPTLIEPAPSTVAESAFHVAYTLPEAPLAGSVTLNFNDGDDTNVTLTMGNSTSASFTLDPAAVVASPVASATATLIPNGTYTVTLAYSDAAGNVATPDTATNFVIHIPASSSSSSEGAQTGGGGNRRGGSEARTTGQGSSSGTAGTSSSARSHVTATADGKTQVFTDVYTDDWFGSYVKKLVELNIFGGYADKEGKPLNLYGPADSITLGQLAKVATILRNKNDFDPKPTGDEWFKPYIGAMLAYDASVFTGDIDPLTKATRGQVIHTILEALGIPLTKVGVGYSDVPADHPYIQAIATASSLGIVSGDAGQDTFRPDDSVNRAEVAKMVVLALSL